MRATGLKPVHRRILYGMRLLQLNPDSAFKKSAKIVGDVMGTFHPHGDQAIYDALVRLAQDFSSRYPLVDGQGNFGHVDGDNPAAMRYTESRLTGVAEALLEGIDEDAVDFRPTYDGSDREPVVLPATFPITRQRPSGTPVGMATSVPPHNAGELCQALIALVENPKIRTARFSPGPGPDSRPGTIVDDAATIQEAYRTGRGSFRVRARWKKEEGSRGTYQIIVNQIPFQVQKAKLIERIAQLIDEKKLSALDSVRDESTEDVRIVLIPKSRAIGLRSDGALFRQTISGLASVEFECARQGVTPKVMSLRDVLMAFLDHRRGARARSRHRLGADRRTAGCSKAPRGLSQPRQGDPHHPHRGRAEAETDEGVPS
jgi:topoisomerase-4 subunit A